MQDINTYLTTLSKQLILEQAKKEKIDISIDNLKRKIWGLFQDRLHLFYVFGSYDRETIISIDEDADVDVLVTFKQNEFQPQTYLNHIRDFCKTNYPRSEIYPDHPTIALELDHIKIELVPSFTHSNGVVKIPAPRSKELKWINTSPLEFKNKLLAKDKSNKNLIIPLVRVFKYWNLLQGKPFSSYELEKFIISKEFFSTTFRDYYFAVAGSLETLAKTDQQKKSIADIKEKSRRLKGLEQIKTPEYIEPELMSFLPLLKSE